MAIFRKVHTSFWSDTFVSDLDRDRKLFYLYLITNERTKQCGIYEISKKQIAFDLGVSSDTVSKQLTYFIEQDKIMYNDLTKELAIKNWNKYNSSSSPKVQSCINKEMKDVKDTVLIEYINGMYTASQEEQEEEQDPEEEQKETDGDIETKFLSWFNNQKFIHTGKKGKFLILSSTDFNNLKKLRETYNQEDFKEAIPNLFKSEWAENNNGFSPSHFLRVDNFNKFLNQGEETTHQQKTKEQITLESVNAQIAAMEANK
jgi:hypothetical protein